MLPFQHLVRLYTRYELPGWGRIYDHFVGGWQHDALWKDEPRRIVRGKLDRYLIELDLSSWSQRMTYFLGRFYDLELQLVMMHFLREGDRVVDIGANVGMVTRLASQLVGQQGVVDSFEPNPACVEAIHDSIRRNSIRNIRIHAVAVGDSTSTLPLTVPRYNSGEGTLVAGASDFAGNADVVQVPVVPGDEAIEADPRPPVFIKIDVEGFEYRVLTGIRKTLATHRPLVATEVVSSHLARDSRTAGDIFAFMRELGYEGRQIAIRRSGLLGRRVKFTSVSAESHGDDVLWVHGDSEAKRRLDALWPDACSA